MSPLNNWLEIADRYENTLLLGNGASISLDACFSYGSLFEKAKAVRRITDDVSAVFDYFETSDFEHVLRMLWYTFNVNQALNIGDTRTRQAYFDLRDALIQTVREHHVSFQAIQHHLNPIQDFMGRFQTVLSLNYDLTVYWAMLEGNERRGGNWFKDCWVGANGGFEGDWEYLRQPYNVDGATLVFFPHGSLLFVTDPENGEVKVSVGNAVRSLLESIVEEWRNRNALPMFVSEGESVQKERAIARHGYLSAVYNDVMTAIGPSVAVYGWGFGDNDEHILRRIASRRVGRIAVSVLRGGRSDAEIDRHCQGIRLKIAHHNDQAVVEFFDAESPGAWKHPRPIP